MHTFPFLPIDYLFTGVGSQPITVAVAFSHWLDEDVLHQGLQQALAYFPLQTMIAQKNRKEYEFRFAPNGLQFSVQHKDVPLEQITSIGDFILPVVSEPDQPLCRITLTQTPTGSVLALSIAHALVDGFSYFHFFSSWARLCRGDRILLPSLDRQGILTSLQTVKTKITEEQILQDCGLFYDHKLRSVANGTVKEERFFIVKEELTAQLGQIKKEYPHYLLSENDYIVAFIWKKYLPLWCQRADDPMTFVTCPVDFRRVVKTLPKTYFGCAVCFATASIGLEQLLQQPLAELVLLVHRATRAVNEAYAMRSLQTLDGLRDQQGITALQRVHLKHPLQGLIVTNLTRMPVLDLDFGSGAPYNFTFFSEVLGSAAILPAKEGVQVVVVHPLDVNK